MQSLLQELVIHQNHGQHIDPNWKRNLHIKDCVFKSGKTCVTNASNHVSSFPHELRWIPKKISPDFTYFARVAIQKVFQELFFIVKRGATLVAQSCWIARHFVPELAVVLCRCAQPSLQFDCAFPVFRNPITVPWLHFISMPLCLLQQGGHFVFDVGWQCMGRSRSWLYSSCYRWMAWVVARVCRMPPLNGIHLPRWHCHFQL